MTAPKDKQKKEPCLVRAKLSSRALAAFCAEERRLFFPFSYFICFFYFFLFIVCIRTHAPRNPQTSPDFFVA